MKTDRFADSIRRKLDSIRPEFSERDWTKMQAMLKQTGPLPNATPTRPRMFSGQAARLIAAGAAGTALFLGTTLYQTYELNRLRNSTQPTGHTTAQVDSARTITTDTSMLTRSDRSATDTDATDAPESAPAVVRDTVYIDRYIRVPATTTPERTERLARTPNAAIDRSTESVADRESTADRDVPQRRYTSAKPAPTANRPVDAVEPATVAGNQRATTPADRPSGSTEQPGTSESGIREPGQPSRNQSSSLARQSGANRAGDRAGAAIDRNTATIGRDKPVGGNAGAGSGSNGTSIPSGSESVAGSNTPSISRTEVIERIDARTDKPASVAGEIAGLAAIVAEPIQVQPVLASNIAWDQRLLQRSRRMRPARTVVVGGPTLAKSSEEQAAPEKPARQSAPSLVKVRIGAGSDLNGRLWSAGGYAELLAGKHVTFSIGISRATFDNGNYITEGIFNQRYQAGLVGGPAGSDFRREFGLEKRIDPRHEIINIGLQTVRLVMPLTIGYRLPVSSSFAITPTLGTILNLQSQEQVSYIIRRPPSMPPYGYGSEYSSNADCQYRPVSMLNNVTLGATVEWQRKHWGIQAGPILTISSQPDPDWVSSLSGGLRARAFFQF
ncbi:hypothetical protein [Spirosoma rhododendri]|uniref:Outer membrane protein beta-barrel domain-containing protein n=1 Tax=Spirosoma rhododendri TaxID=2728024 RepID=A0A7L5DX18_9BACT|nr:hypothetical protein [Spirosoma rhododendri]QJD80090.1 hypothetical protein HH216_17985 [Spirosoma rhododendri]